MAEKDLMEAFKKICWHMEPCDMQAFESFVKGETNVWPEGTRYKLSQCFEKDVIAAELGGPNDELALRILAALALSWDIVHMVHLKGGVRALSALRTPFISLSREPEH
jgi:hypothetical protein